MKWITFCLLFISYVNAENDVVDADSAEDTARFAFVNLNSDGSISFTFNATSLQYTLLAALTLLVLAAILLPLLGLVGIGKDYDTDYGYDQSGYQSYETPSSSYSNYGKRSFSWMGPVMEALSKAYEKYEKLCSIMDPLVVEHV